MTAGAQVVGTGMAVPYAATQDELWEGFFRSHYAGQRQGLAARIFRGAGVRRRHTVVDLTSENPCEWSTAQRMARYTREAPPLGHQAVTAALAEADLDAAEVGLFTVASCTGYDTPGLDIRLAGTLGFSADVQRLLVGHMGCYAALPALGNTVDFVRARGRPAVLLCLELASLHLQAASSDTQQMVTHALFADAAAALVVQPSSGTANQRALGGSTLEWMDVVAHTDRATEHHMTWQVTDHGFRMGLAEEVPEVLARHVRPVLERLLERNGLQLADVAGWAVHPGGPRILDTVGEALGLPTAALDSSRAVLAEYGNCSSPTVLLVLDHLMRNSGQAGSGGPVVVMAFGPGLTLYAALLRMR